MLQVIPAPAFAEAVPWHLDGWKARAVVEIPEPLLEHGVDTAGVKVLCQGRTKLDGSDYRVLDLAGKPVLFQLVYHDAARYSLISFHAGNPRQQYFVYFDNPEAMRSGRQIVADSAPGSGPPRGEWVPRYGLVFATVQRPDGKNPETCEELAKLIAGSRAMYGARYQRRIADGYNPFGPSDYYISVYRGWIRIPKAGKYWFCAASNEASFSFVDGRKLVHWPGRHTADRGARGEKNAVVELTEGFHYIEYYQEEVMLQQMAFLGWRPLASDGPFSAIPESVYTAPHAAVIMRYESHGGMLAAFEPEILDSIWPVQRHEGQYTRLQFKVATASAQAGDATCKWDFGDGQTATGSSIEHVYVKLGRYPVTLTITGPQGSGTALWPLEVYEIQHVYDQMKEGSPADYVKLVKTYERARLDAGALKELAHLLAESEQPAAALEAGKEFINRFADKNPQLVPNVQLLMAECALQLDPRGVDEAIANYQALVTADISPDKKIDALARLIQLLGIERKLPEKAEELLSQAETIAREARKDEPTLAAYRRALIACGDVRLWSGKRDGALELYRRAEAVSKQVILPQVRAARIGSYPDSIRGCIIAANYDAALDIVEQWGETFPTEKAKGHTFFWRGKLLALCARHEEAVRCLKQCVELAIGADFETEAYWLLAQSLEQLGRSSEAQRELGRLAACGIDDNFTRMARQKLNQPLGKN